MYSGKFHGRRRVHLIDLKAFQLLTYSNIMLPKKVSRNGIWELSYFEALKVFEVNLMNKTINELINTQKSDLNILGAPDRKWSTFGNLKTLSSYVNSQLRSYGVAVEDRVAIVLPNGPEMASAFLTMAQSCTTAPLNPNYREEEYLFYLKT